MPLPIFQESYSYKAIDTNFYAVSPHTLENYQAGYEALWARAAVIAVQAATNWARKILSFKARYVALEKRTRVPWWVIGALHMRENGCDFRGVLHNGELIVGTGRKTTLVPRNRGPFATFEEAAEDALKDYNWVKTWTIAAVAFIMESFNGFGYRGHGIPSPYLWGGSSVQVRGKYIRDGVYDSGTWDPQMGGMTVLKALAELDATVAASIKTPVKTQKSPPVSSPKPQAPKPHKTPEAAPVAVSAISLVLAQLGYVSWYIVAGIMLATLGFIGYNIYKRSKK
jgi:lysozyme family protein